MDIKRAITFFYCGILFSAVLLQLFISTSELPRIALLGGFAIRMNPYNLEKSYTRYNIYAISSNNEVREIRSSSLMEPTFPVYLLGSFKYFYREKTTTPLHHEIARRFCKLIEEKEQFKADQLVIKYMKDNRQVAKEFKC